MKTTPPQSSFLPLIPMHTNTGCPLFVNAEGVRMSNSREGGSKGAAFVMIWERTPDRGSRGPASRVTTPKPHSDITPTLCLRGNTAAPLRSGPPVHRNRPTKRVNVPTTILGPLGST